MKVGSRYKSRLKFRLKAITFSFGFIAILEIIEERLLYVYIGMILEERSIP